MTPEGIGIAVACVGVGVQVVYGFRWLTGLESRIASHEKVCEKRQEWMDERHKDIMRSLNEIRERL